MESGKLSPIHLSFSILNFRLSKRAFTFYSNSTFHPLVRLCYSIESRYICEAEVNLKT